MRRVTLPLLAALCGLLAHGGSARAQAPQPTVAAAPYREAARLNAELIRGYAWKMKVAVAIGGNPRPAKFYQMRCDLIGNLERTPLTPPEPAKTRMSLDEAVQMVRQEEFRDWAADLSDLVRNYLVPSPETMLAFYDRAVLSPAGDGTVQALARGFLQTDDSVAYLLDQGTKAPLKLKFTTHFEGDRVEGDVEFRQLPGGLNASARVTLAVAAKEVVANIESSDYVKQ